MATSDTPTTAVDQGEALVLDDPVTTADTAAVVAEVVPEKPAAPAPVKRQSSGFLGTVFGGALAVGAGFGVAQYVGPLGWFSSQNTETTQALAALQTKVDDLTTALASGPDAAALDTVKADLAALQTSVAELAEPSAQIADLDQRLAQLEGKPLSDGGVSPADLTAFRAEIAEIKARIGAGVSGDTSAEDALQAGVAAAQAKAAEMTAQAETMQKSAIVRSALLQIQAGFDSGGAFLGALPALADAGVQVPPALGDGTAGNIPTLNVLIDSYPDAARAALEAAIRADMGETLTDRMTSFLRSQTGVRSLTPRDGTDPDAVLSRAEAALRASDLPTVLTELGTLPPDAQSAMADWVAQAKTRLSATEALAALLAAQPQQ